MNDGLQVIALAMKSKGLVHGSEVINSIRKQTAKYVIIAEDASDNTKKKLTDKCSYYNIEYFIGYNSSILSQKIGKNNRMAVALTNQGFVKIFKEKVGVIDGKK